MTKGITLKDCDAKRAEMLVAEIGKVRCWLTGFAAGRHVPGALGFGVPGEDALRQIQCILKDSLPCLWGWPADWVADEMNVAAFHFENWDKPDNEARSVLVITPGLWKMRNGHTAEIQKQIDIPYKDGMTGKPKVYSIWKGLCVECEAPMTWTINGCYAAMGKHRNDIIRRA